MTLSFTTTALRIFPVITVGLIITEIIFTNQFAGIGARMRSTDVQIDALREQNALLEQKVASASSLSTIRVKAEEMGFHQPQKNQYLTVVSDFPVASINSH